jgi:hypothetical protein
MHAEINHYWQHVQAADCVVLADVLSALHVPRVLEMHQRHVFETTEACMTCSLGSVGRCPVLRGVLDLSPDNLKSSEGRCAYRIAFNLYLAQMLASETFRE